MDKRSIYLSVRKPFYGLFFGFILLLLGNCTFLDLKKDIEPLNSASTVQGRVIRNFDRDTPILIALYQENQAGQATLVNYDVLYGSSMFEMVVEPGSYYLVAFEDLNEDFTRQDDEYAGWYGKPTLINIKSDKIYTDLEIRLLSPEQAKFALPELYKSNIKREPLTREEFPLGEIVTQNDPRLDGISPN